MSWIFEEWRLTSLDAQQEKAGADARAIGGQTCGKTPVKIGMPAAMQRGAPRRGQNPAPGAPDGWQPEAPRSWKDPPWWVDVGRGCPCPLTPQKVSLGGPVATAAIHIPARVEIHGRRAPPDHRAWGTPAAAPSADASHLHAAPAPAPQLQPDPPAAREAAATGRRGTPGGAPAGDAPTPHPPRGRGAVASAPWLGPGRAGVVAAPRQQQGAAPGREGPPGGRRPGERSGREACSARGIGEAVVGEIVTYLSRFSCLREGKPAVAKAALPSGGGAAAAAGGTQGADAGSDAAPAAREGAAASWTASPAEPLSLGWEAWSPRGGEGPPATGGPGGGHSPAVAATEHADGEDDAEGEGEGDSEVGPVEDRPVLGEQEKSPVSKKKASLDCWLQRQMATIWDCVGPGEIALWFDAGSEGWSIEGFTNCYGLFWGGRWAAGAADPPPDDGDPEVVDAWRVPLADRSLKEWIKPGQREPFLLWAKEALAEPGGAALPPPRVFGEPLLLRPPSLRNGKVQFAASVALSPPPAGRTGAAAPPPPDAVVRILFENIALRQIRRRPEDNRSGGRGRGRGRWGRP